MVPKEINEYTMPFKSLFQSHRSERKTAHKCNMKQLAVGIICMYLYCICSVFGISGDGK